MDHQKFLASPLVRLLVFLWVIIFPIVYIGLPVAEMFTGERPYTMAPVWAGLLWLLSPFVAMIILKYADGK